MHLKLLAFAAAASTVAAQQPSFCDKYTTALFTDNTAANQYKLLVAVVNTAVIGNCMPPILLTMTPTDTLQIARPPMVPLFTVSSLQARSAVSQSTFSHTLMVSLLLPTKADLLVSPATSSMTVVPLLSRPANLLMATPPGNSMRPFRPFSVPINRHLLTCNLQSPLDPSLPILRYPSRLLSTRWLGFPRVFCSLISI